MFFGTAVDGAIGKLLENPSNDFYAEFARLWKKTNDFSGKPVIIFDNNEIKYAHADFDKDVLEAFKEDTLPVMLGWMKELNLESFIKFNKKDINEETGEITLSEPELDWAEAYSTCAKAKKNKYKRCPDNYLTFFNRCSWLSLYYKGMLLIESFYQQFYPKIEKVLAVQKHGTIKDEETGDSITGYIDMILKLHGIERPIIFDLKTSARPYTDEQIEHTEQLTIYLAMEGQRFNTESVGYVVLSKAIHKDTIANCKSCGFKRDGRHKTCNNRVPFMVDGVIKTYATIEEFKNNEVRCNGEWNETVELRPQVQVLIRDKNDKQVNDVLESQSNIIVGMKNKVVYRNLSKCNNWYGNTCPYKNICHGKKDVSDL